jgi:hypothetical protein
MKRKDDTTNGPVTLAEQQLAQAQAALAANVKESQERAEALARLREQVGADPEGKDSRAQAQDIIRHDARVTYLDKHRKALEVAVVDAEVVFREAQAVRAQAEITAQDSVLDALNGEIIEALAALLVKIEEHEGVVAGRDNVAHEFGLPAPGRRRFLFPKQQLRSHAADLLRDRLRLEHAVGVQVAPAP